MWSEAIWLDLCKWTVYEREVHKEQGYHTIVVYYFMSNSLFFIIK